MTLDLNDFIRPYRKKVPEPLLRVVIVRDDDGEVGDFKMYTLASVERVDGLIELRRFNALTSAEVVCEMWSAIGVDIVTNQKGIPDEALKESSVVRLVVTGKLWHHHYSTAEGEDYDGGFNVETVEEVVRDGS